MMNRFVARNESICDRKKESMRLNWIATTYTAVLDIYGKKSGWKDSKLNIPLSEEDLNKTFTSESFMERDSW